jgi:4-alpha-glucanotransferase
MPVFRTSYLFLRVVISLYQSNRSIFSLPHGDEAGVEGYKDPFNRSTYPWGKENMELLDWYRYITALRNKYDVLKTGIWNPLSPNKDVFGYIREIQCRDVFGREIKSNRAIVLVNRGFNISFIADLYIGGKDLFRMYDVLDENKIYEVREGRLNAEIPPLASMLLILNPLSR